MHAHHESWFTRLLNEYLAGPATALLDAVGRPPQDAAHPWTDWMGTQILVALLLVGLALLVRVSLSVERPGTLQQVLEGVYGLMRGQARDVIGHHRYGPHVPFVATLFLFIATMNLIGIIPAFESPTMFPMVPAGCAMATFLYFNFWGVKEQGAWGYVKHFLGPVWWLSWFLLIVELISLLVRPLSLTIRLYANMVAGEQVTLNFLRIVPVIPVIFMGLHVFVGLLQAFIFAMLTMVYVGGAVAHEEH